MTPRQADATTRTAPDLFRERLDNMLNQHHALYRLSDLRIRGQVAQCTREGAATLTILKCLCIVRPDPVHQWTVSWLFELAHLRLHPKDRSRLINKSDDYPTSSTFVGLDE